MNKCTCSNIWDSLNRSHITSTRLQALYISQYYVILYFVRNN